MSQCTSQKWAKNLSDAHRPVAGGIVATKKGRKAWGGQLASHCKTRNQIVENSVMCSCHLDYFLDNKFVLDACAGGDYLLSVKEVHSFENFQGQIY